MYRTLRVPVLLRYVTLALLYLWQVWGGPTKREDLFWDLTYKPYSFFLLNQRDVPAARASSIKTRRLGKHNREIDAPDQPVSVCADHDDEWPALFEPGGQVPGHVPHGRRQSGCAGTGEVNGGLAVTRKLSDIRVGRARTSTRSRSGLASCASGCTRWEPWMT